ncbi:MAG: prepilin peptidase [Bacteriovoracia bacterium]
MEELNTLFTRDLSEVLPLFTYLAFFLLTVVCTITDVLKGKILNILTIPMFFFGLGISLYYGVISYSLISVGLAFVFLFPTYVFGVFGAGDIKLLLALATITSFSDFIGVFFLSLILGSCGALVLLIKQKRLGSFFKAIWQSLKSLIVPGLSFEFPKISDKSKAPFAIAISLSFLAFLLSRGQS